MKLDTLLDQHARFRERQAAKDARAAEKALRKAKWEATQRQWRENRLARERYEDENQAFGDGARRLDIE